ncbi:MAG: hypothetical protein LIP16_10715 [Clostridium sp.]|nr:hypothetical protein [Clostridium sp.]
MNEKLHRREEVRKIVAERGLTDMFRIDPKFMRKAEGLPEEAEEMQEAPPSKWKRGAQIALNGVIKAAGSVAGASYLATNAANVAGAGGLAYGYWAGGITGFVSSVPNVINQGKNVVNNWEGASNYERYKDVKGLIGGVSGLAGNSRNMIVQAADGFAGVTWNTPGYTYTESGVNPAQLEADIGFNIINNALVALGGVDQVYESSKRKKDIREMSSTLKSQQIEGVEGIKEAIDDPRIEEIITSLKDPKAKRGTFIPALTKMLEVVEDLHQNAVAERAPEEKLERLGHVKDYLKDNMSSFEETEKLVRTHAMAMKQANLETASGAYDIVKGSVSVAAVSSRFVSSPMGGIAGLVDGVTGVVGDAALRGKFFGLEELWDNKSIMGQRNRRKAAANEVDAAICLCGDRNYNVKSATQQLVQDVIKDYNGRNPESPLPNNDDTKRSIASKVYYELGSVERSKAGLGNNVMLIRAAELRTAALEEPLENGPYHWCIKSLGLKCSGEELPGVDQIAQRMGCNRNWRDLVKHDEIDKKEMKWADKQARGAEGGAADGSARSEQAKADIDQALENTTPKRKFGRDVFMKRERLKLVEEEEPTVAQTKPGAADSPKKEQPSGVLPGGETGPDPNARTVRPKAGSTVLPPGGQPAGSEKKLADHEIEKMMSSAPRVPTEKPEEIIDKKLEKMIASAPPVPANEPGEASEAKTSSKADIRRRRDVRLLSQEELDSMGLGARREPKPAKQAVKRGSSPEAQGLAVPGGEVREPEELSVSPLSRTELARKPVRKQRTRL